MFIGPSTVPGDFGSYGMLRWEFFNYFLGDVKNLTLFTAAALYFWHIRVARYALLFFADMGLSSAVTLAWDCDPYITFELSRIRWFVFSSVLLAFEALIINDKRTEPLTHD